MPGIAGIIVKKPNCVEQEQIDLMVRCMLHDPIYTHGTYKDNEHGFYAGYVAIRGSFVDCMPIFNEKKDLVLFLAGECFGDEETYTHLRQQGHDFRPRDAGYLIHYYEEKGEDFIHYLNGNFAGVILDLRKSSAIVFNDRFGIQRIVYHENDQGFYFSSEAKSLLKILPQLREADFQSIGDYLCYDCVLQNRTFFSGISLMPCGSAWSFDMGTVKKKQYFDPSEYENQPIFQDQDRYFRAVVDMLKTIVPRYFKEDCIGMSLTGGHDTRLLMACRNPAPGTLPCYTFGGRNGETFDIRIARKVAIACNQTHTTITHDEDYLDRFPSFAEKGIYMTDGLSNLFFTDLAHFNKRAREISPIRMTGVFGGQVLRPGSLFWHRPPNENLIAHDFNKYMTQAQRNLANETRGKNTNSLSFLLFKEIPWLWGWGGSMNALHLTPRYPFLDNDLIKLLFRAPPATHKSIDFQLRLIAEMSPKLYSIVTNHGYCGSDSALMSKIIRSHYYFWNKINKLYVREVLPYNLHHTLMRTNSVFHLERLALGRFTYRMNAYWFRDELADYVKSILLDAKTLDRPYWEKSFIKKITEDHTTGHANYVLEIRKIITLELIHRTLLEGI